MRMTRFLYHMIKRHWQGNDDPHYFWFYDTSYPDMILDEDDMKPVNFRYTDQKVSPEAMNGYYPYGHLRYGDFLSEKKDTQFAYRGLTKFENKVQ